MEAFIYTFYGKCIELNHSMIQRVVLTRIKLLLTTFFYLKFIYIDLLLRSFDIFNFQCQH